MMIDYAGQQVGNYRLLRRLGSGGFASVYLGQHVRISTQQAAIKILHLIDVDIQKFQQEAETMASLVHPNIIRLFDFDFHNGVPFLVVDYAPGGSLRTRHPRGMQVPLSSIVRYIKEIAGALQYAHDRHVIHRDIKPDNILIGLHNELRLSDFGIAVLTQTGRTTLQASQGIIGTPHYMAPEMFRGKPERVSDQYALGIVVYEWLCGTPPFTNGDFIQIGFQHHYMPAPSLHERLPQISLDVEAVVMKALAKDPSDRFPSVRAFAEALEMASSSRQLAKVFAPVVPVVSKKPKFLVARQLVGGEVYAISWSLDGARLAISFKLSGVQVRDITSGDLVYTCGENTDIYTVSWSPDGGLLASGSYDDVLVWKASNGQLLRSYKGHADDVVTVSWSPDSRLLASGTLDGTLRVWEVSSGIVLYSYMEHTNTVSSVSWSPDGKWLASSSYDGTVQVRQASNGRLVHRYTEHLGEVNVVSWSPDGRWLASGSADKTVQVWEISGENMLCNYINHADWVNTVSWSPDGRRIVSGSADKTVQVWEASSGRLLYVYKHTDVVSAVSWSPNGKQLAFGTMDGTVQTWEVM